MSKVRPDVSGVFGVAIVSGRSTFMGPAAAGSSDVSLMQLGRPGIRSLKVRVSPRDGVAMWSPSPATCAVATPCSRR
jgi:hypothetical protein